MTAVWQVQVKSEEESGWPGGLWHDYQGRWAEKLEAAYEWMMEPNSLSNPERGDAVRPRHPVVELWNDEGEEDHVMYKVYIRDCLQIRVRTGASRTVRRVLVTTLF